MSVSCTHVAGFLISSRFILTLKKIYCASKKNNYSYNYLKLKCINITEEIMYLFFVESEKLFVF